MIKKGNFRGKMIPKEFFGMHLVSLNGWLGYTTPFPSSLGIGSVRIWDTGTTWRRVEPAKGNFDFSRIDAILNILKANNVNDILFTLGQAPLWATNNVGPSTGSFNPNPPINIQDWRDYVSALVGRYKNKITSWEIWNEIDYDFFWVGTQDKIQELTIEASSIIRSIDPNAKIIGANTTSISPSVSLPYMRETKSYTDIDSIHMYGRPVSPDEKVVMANYLLGQQISSNNVREKQNTEYTYNSYFLNGSIVSGNNNPMPENLAASYISRLLMGNWICGISKCYFYAFDNFEYNNIHLVSSSDKITLTKAGRAFSYLSSLLTGGTLSLSTPEGKKNKLSFTTKEGKIGEVFWCRDGDSDSFDPSRFNQIRDVEGVTLPKQNMLIYNSPIFGFY